MSWRPSVLVSVIDRTSGCFSRIATDIGRTRKVRDPPALGGSGAFFDVGRLWYISGCDGGSSSDRSNSSSEYWSVLGILDKRGVFGRVSQMVNADVIPLITSGLLGVIAKRVFSH
jgi:hypothetical protein